MLPLDRLTPGIGHPPTPRTPVHSTTRPLLRSASVSPPSTTTLLSSRQHHGARQPKRRGALGQGQGQVQLEEWAPILQGVCPTKAQGEIHLLVSETDCPASAAGRTDAEPNSTNSDPSVRAPGHALVACGADAQTSAPRAPCLAGEL
jgi:hypothetical protein